VDKLAVYIVPEIGNVCDIRMCTCSMVGSKTSVAFSILKTPEVKKLKEEG
jgi:hypothetical protein